MMNLVARVNELKAGEVGKLVARRAQEFKNLGSKGNEEWFSELSFCILTANSSAKLCMKIQRELGAEGFLGLPPEELKCRLRMAGHRFWGKRAGYIVEARRFSNIKDTIMKFKDEREARE